jgi:disulfide bond formation protein DsbB
MAARLTGHRLVALALALAAGAALGAALGAEHWGGLVPCPLCLWERHPYRALIAVGLLALVVPPRPGRALLWLGVLLAILGAGLGLLHVGVERGFWPSPLPACAAPDLSGLSISERLARMPATPAKPCDEPVYLLDFLPVSMAEMNFLYAAALAAALIFLLRRNPS